MLNFQPKKPHKGQGFTLDPVKREQAKARVSGRRYLHLAFLLGVAIISGSMLWGFLDKISRSLGPVTNRLKQEIPLTPMAKPSIAELPAMPDATAISEHPVDASDQLANRSVPLWIDQPDASTMAWVAAVLARDHTAPPLPQRVDARDLVLRHVKVGENVMITGMLEDSQPAPIAGGAIGYQRLLVGLPDQQYLEVIAPASATDLFIGDQVLVIGRFLGFANLPPSDQPAPVQPAEVITPAPSESATVEAPIPIPTKVEVPLIAARVAAKPAAQREQDNPYLLRGSWKLPADIYENVDDDLLLVETRPYYYTLGQVQLDRTTPGVFADAKSANETGSAIHKDPAKFRGQPFTIRGRVFNSWEDTGVAQDQPFGVSRVVRVIVWSEDWGDWDINDRGEIKTSRKLILRAFEIAAITHEPLPQPGDIITTTGRFLRLRSMEVKPNTARDRAMGITRQSDRAHTFLFVSNDYTVEPTAPTYDFSLLNIAVVLAAAMLGLLLLNMARREGKKKELVFDSVRKLRASRHALKEKQKSKDGEAVPTPPDPGSSTSPPTPSAPEN